MSKKPIPVRFDEKEIREIKQFADINCNGNFSCAVRMLCTNALKPEQAQTAIEQRIEQVLNAGIERALKIEKRSTKASLANLALLSMFLPSIAEGVRVVGETLIEDKKAEEQEYTHVFGKTKIDIWNCGGNLGPK
jgi:hypothetical protein